MNRFLLILALLAASPLIAQAPPEKPTSEEMVKAAKEAKEKRKKPQTKVLTNKDVKKAKGKLIVIEGPKTAEASKPAGPTSIEDQERRRKERIAAAEVVSAAEKKVQGLERSVEELEQRYYQENDPNYRDEVIRDRFNQAKRQLDEARAALADARDALTKIENPSP
jgi:hypothetical protein